MTKVSTAVQPATTETNNAAAKQVARQLILQGTADQFETEAAEDMLAAIQEAKRQDINTAVPGSINMVSKYLKFTQLKGIPVRRHFMGFTAQPLIDFNTKEPICDPETQEQMYGPAAIFFDPKTESMEINMAFDVVKTLNDHKPKLGTMVELIFKGLETTSTGRNKQTFSIVFLK